MRNEIDLHIHTTASDGSDTPAQLIANLKRSGIRIFAVTDHDTIGALAEVSALTGPEITFIPGVEFSCISSGGKCHILGYGFDPADPHIRSALAEGYRRRREKLNIRLRYLEDTFGIILTEAERNWIFSRSCPGKPHLGRILLQRGLAPDVSTAIARYVNPCRTPGDRIEASMAIDAILHAGGIPVWAHPLGGEGERRLTREEFKSLLEELLALGIRGMECRYSRYSLADSDFLLSQAQVHGLLVSGGSDYHGINKDDLPLGRLCAEDCPIPAGELSIAAHLLGQSSTSLIR